MGKIIKTDRREGEYMNTSLFENISKSFSYYNQIKEFEDNIFKISSSYNEFSYLFIKPYHLSEESNLFKSLETTNYFFMFYSLNNEFPHEKKYICLDFNFLDTFFSIEYSFERNAFNILIGEDGTSENVYSINKFTKLNILNKNFDFLKEIFTIFAFYIFHIGKDRLKLINHSLSDTNFNLIKNKINSLQNNVKEASYE